MLAVPVTKILPNLPSTPLIVFYARIHGMFAGFQEKGGGLYSNNLSCPCDSLNPAENIQPHSSRSLIQSPSPSQRITCWKTSPPGRHVVPLHNLTSLSLPAFFLLRSTSKIFKPIRKSTCWKVPPLAFKASSTASLNCLMSLPTLAPSWPYLQPPPIFPALNAFQRQRRKLDGRNSPGRRGSRTKSGHECCGMKRRRSGDLDGDLIEQRVE